MKVKIFSHKSDPDGIGSVIVVSLAYQNTSFEVFPNNRELDERLDEFLGNKEYLDYDKILMNINIKIHLLLQWFLYYAF